MKRGTERILTTQPAPAARSAGDDPDHDRVLVSYAVNRPVGAIRPHIGARVEAQIAIPLLS